MSSASGSSSSARPVLGKKRPAAGGHPKPKSFYKMSSQNKRKKFGGRLRPLCVGVQGILITTGDKEKICVPEAYNLLNEYADQLYGQEEDNLSDSDTQARSDPDSRCHDDSNGSDEGMAMAAGVGGDEVAGGRGGMRERERRFSAMNSGAKHVVFIKCSAEVDPTKLVHTMLSDILATRIMKSRYCQRILPVVKVCHTSLEDIRRCAEDVLDPHFHVNTTDTHTFAVNYKCRNHSSLKREEVIRVVAGVVTGEDDMYPHRVDFDTPELVIIVEIIRNLCCMSVVRDFHRLRKYNIQSLTAIDDTEPKTGSKATPPAPPPSSKTVGETCPQSKVGVSKVQPSLPPETQTEISEATDSEVRETDCTHPSATVPQGTETTSVKSEISPPPKPRTEEELAQSDTDGTGAASAKYEILPPPKPRTEEELVQGSSPPNTDVMHKSRTTT